MKKIRFGVIGLGHRGSTMIRDNLVHFDELEFVALSDLYEDRVDDAEKLILEARPDAKPPFKTTNYKEIFEKNMLDAVYISAYWESHLEISMAAMRAGVAVACEVGGAYSIDELYELVKTQEETGTPFMFMENCCYNKHELLGTALARSGKLGKIVHASGMYGHDLRSEISNGNINRHYRLRNYTQRNCENYPTHELGPIARLLNVNRGNRLVSLVSMASSAHGLEQYINDNELYKQDPTLKDRRFNQGDIVTTIIKCANGESIVLTLDTTLPRSYDRDFTLRGTKGSYSMSTNSVFLDGDNEYWDHVEYLQGVLNNATAYEDEYLPDVWKNMTEEEIKRGHGGMDGIMFSRFIRSLTLGEPMDIDVYDGATWMAITALSEISIAQGGAPQAIPDFTNGKWLIREPKDVLPLTK